MPIATPFKLTRLYCQALGVTTRPVITPGGIRWGQPGQGRCASRQALLEEIRAALSRRPARELYGSPRVHAADGGAGNSRMPEHGRQADERGADPLPGRPAVPGDDHRESAYAQASGEPAQPGVLGSKVRTKNGSATSRSVLTGEGTIYLANVLDVFSRKIVRLEHGAGHPQSRSCAWMR